MRRLKLTLAYDGTNYAGWQSQPNAPTLQDTLERALAKLTGESIRATASGRTDAGVHALGQVVSLSTGSRHGTQVFQRALNAELPDDFAVLAAEEVAEEFDARRSATGKLYRYLLDNGPIADIFQRRFRWHVVAPLDVPAMQEAANELIGRHDFSSFEASGSPRSSSVRTVKRCEVSRQPAPRESEINIEVEADGFLYNMVRNIVGTLVEVGRGAREVSWPGEVLRAADRRAAGPTAPPQGLFLVRVDYGGV
jgi:tRNA pseudouridine38-40 synthase